MIRIAISGANGRMGRAVFDLVKESENHSVIYGVDTYPYGDLPYPIYSSFDGVDLAVDVIIDFSSPLALDGLLDYAIRTNTKVVLATTGYTDEQYRRIKYASEQVAIFHSANMSLGVSLLGRISKESAKFLGDDFDIEIVESHHSKKIDAPSGTALSLAKGINSVKDKSMDLVFGRDNFSKRREQKEIGIHSIRGGSISGIHEVLFLGNGECVKLAHQAESKDIFVRGALRSAEFLMTKQSGLYSMDALLIDRLPTTAVEGERVCLSTIKNLDELQYATLLRIAKDKGVVMTDVNFSWDESTQMTFAISDDYVNEIEAILSQDIFSNIRHSMISVCKLVVSGVDLSHDCNTTFEMLSLMKSIGAKVYHVMASSSTLTLFIDKDKLKDAIATTKAHFKI